MSHEATYENGNNDSTPDVFALETHNDQLHNTVIPNQLFVGGIDYKINEREIRDLFSQHGSVKEVKIVMDCWGISKGYGFVTFETEEEVLKILRDVDEICYKDKKLNIGQAVRKPRQNKLDTYKHFQEAQHNHSIILPVSCETAYPTTSNGYSYTYHNGEAYFFNHTINPPAHHWPAALTATPPQSHQPSYQQPFYHHYQPLVPSSSVVYQQLEYSYRFANGGSVKPFLPVMDVASAKNVMFPHSLVHLNTQDYRDIHQNEYHYILKERELQDAFRLYNSQHFTYATPNSFLC